MEARTEATTLRALTPGEVARMDDELVVRAQQGDEAAFAMIAVDVGPRFHAVAYRILRDVALAEDAVQQALLDAWQDLPRLREPARFEAWSYRLLVRVCYAQARRGRRLPEVQLADHDVRASFDEYSRVADRDQLERGFQRLSVEQRAVVVLHHYLGLPVKDVAELVEAPVETVRTRLKRALSALRIALEADAVPQRRDVDIQGEVVA
jgi:RNA polymerase sigma-70 factor (ECF subfamily)